MNLLAFLWLIGCITVVGVWVALLVAMPEQAADVLKALAERIRRPRPTSLDMLNELHRHWEAQDRLATRPGDEQK